MRRSRHDRRRNTALIAARAAMSSPSGSGRPMSRQEVADACNAIIGNLCRQRGIHSPWAGMTERTVGALERGDQTWTNGLYREALRTLFGKNDAQLGIHSSHQQPSLAGVQPQWRSNADAAVDAVTTIAIPAGPASQTQIARTPDFNTASSVRPAADNASEVHEWSSFARMTQLLASQRQMIAPSALLGLVEAHREGLAVLFREASTDRLRGQIGAMLAEASIVASRLWSAHGNRSLAIAHCAHARQLADRLNNPVVAAVARIFEANLHSDAANTIGNGGDLMLGLRLLHEAASAEHLLSPAARARIWAEQAQAYAALQLPNECQDSLTRARTAAEMITDTDRAGLFSDWNLPRLQVYQGTCQLLLGHPGAAADTLTEAIEATHTDSANINVTLAAQVDLATAHAMSGHLEHGCQTLAQTYLRLVDIGNRRGIDRARQARERLQPWDREAPIRALDDVMIGV
jgi:hypothetical protein